MEEKLQELFYECKNELKNIGIDLNHKLVGEITINIAKRNCQRYGCCKQEIPDESTKYIEKVGKKCYIRYAIFKKHNIEVSRWVMNLNTDIIKNTIMHEIIHCLPNCNNHGDEFKKYANYINYKLNYNISRLGDKKQDLKQSNIEIKKEHFNYKIQCSKCDYFFYRKRLNCNFTKKYRCGKCGGKFIILNGLFEL
ncbi:MAG: SprT-like domain-containing protein [Clostridia bacterium]|nr:SprT-like domain-containing protein [Clostridia bacterium]